MSGYQVQQCLFDHLRALERPDAARAASEVSVDGYELDDRERAALAAGSVEEFHALGVHPVLINAYCRANGWRRADYRVLFGAAAEQMAGEGRWRGFASRLRADGTCEVSV